MIDEALAARSRSIEPAVLGQRIKVARIAAGLRQSWLADGLCDKTYISRIEAGERRPDLALLVKLSERLGKPLGVLLAQESRNETSACGGCRGEGGHRRWCREKVGLHASVYGPMSQELNTMADTVGSNDVVLANQLYQLSAKMEAFAWREDLPDSAEPVPMMDRPAYELVRLIQAELDDADQVADTPKHPNYIAVWGVRMLLEPYGGKPHRWQWPLCFECKHQLPLHTYGPCDLCGCAITAEEIRDGARDEDLDEGIRQAAWEDYLSADGRDDHGK